MIELVTLSGVTMSIRDRRVPPFDARTSAKDKLIKLHSFPKVRYDAWIGISSNSACGRNGAPSCHMNAKWSDGSFYDQTDVPDLYVTFSGPEEPPRWKAADNNLNDAGADEVFRVVCEYTCGC